MRILIATDAWHPQVNGVVRTLTSLARAAEKLGVTIEFLSPEGFPSVPRSDLSGIASGAAEPAQDRAAHRAGPAGRHSHRDGRHHRHHDPRLVPHPRPAVHDELHDAVSRIYFGALADPGALDLRRAAPLSWRRGRDHGGDAVADGGAERARISKTSACGRAASTPICSAPTAPSSSICRVRSSSASGGSRSRRISKRFFRSICRAPRS